MNKPNLYPLFRQAWPGVTPNRCPDGLSLKKIDLPRGTQYLPGAGCSFVIVSGHLEEVIRSDQRRVSFAAHTARQIPPPIIGRLIAQKATTLIELQPGWDIALPDAAVMVQAKRDSFMQQLIDRVVSLTADTVRERIVKFCRANPDVKSPSIVARYVGASREMCSRYMIQAGLRERP
ncbi:MAG: hypothetical protein KGI52_11665 [Burkholderiales bacterium]|nr:hypothetical protein [Burkholderiales bacterium]